VAVVKLISRTKKGAGAGDGAYGYLLTPKIGQGRLGLGRPVRPGPRGSLTGCPVAGLAQKGQAV
jgi:hypothetical protein